MGAIKNGNGFVYAILFGNGYVKIGLTRNLKQRMQAYYTHSPIPVIQYAYTQTNNAGWLEKELHELFKDKRTHGEFFDFDRNDWHRFLVFLKCDEWGNESGFYKEIDELYDHKEKVMNEKAMDQR